MCFTCLKIREESLGLGITSNIMKYWGCQDRVGVTEKDIEIAKKIIRENDLGVKRPTKDFNVEELFKDLGT